MNIKAYIRIISSNWMKALFGTQVPCTLESQKKSHVPRAGLKNVQAQVIYLA